MWEQAGHATSDIHTVRPPRARWKISSRLPFPRLIAYDPAGRSQVSLLNLKIIKTWDVSEAYWKYARSHTTIHGLSLPEPVHPTRPTEDLDSIAQNTDTSSLWREAGAPDGSGVASRTHALSRAQDGAGGAPVN